MHNRFKFILVALTVAAVPAQSDDLPVVGGYGFNWLNPSPAGCQKITKQLAATFKKCEVNDNAFGANLPSTACKAAGRVEFLVYRTLKDCRIAFDTMSANGP